jgi:hypothetical protein
VAPPRLPALLALEVPAPLSGSPAARAWAPDPDPPHGENPTWGRRRIQAELRFLGYEVAELTVAKYMRRPLPRPSSTWRAFLEAHIHDIVAIDFFVVPTLTFQLLFGLLILRHDRRELVQVNACSSAGSFLPPQNGCR